LVKTPVIIGEVREGRNGERRERRRGEE